MTASTETACLGLPALAAADHPTTIIQSPTQAPQQAPVNIYSRATHMAILPMLRTRKHRQLCVAAAASACGAPAISRHNALLEHNLSHKNQKASYSWAWRAKILTNAELAPALAIPLR